MHHEIIANHTKYHIIGVYKHAGAHFESLAAALGSLVRREPRGRWDRPIFRLRQRCSLRLDHIRPRILRHRSQLCNSPRTV